MRELQKKIETMQSMEKQLKDENKNLLNKVEILTKNIESSPEHNFKKDTESSMHYSSQLNATSLPNYFNLTSITIPANIETIENTLLSKCSTLNEICVESGNQKFASKDGILFTKNMDEIVWFPSKHQFEEYSIPNTITSIGKSAFSYCSNLTSITIPNSVTSIGDRAFSNCSKLRSIIQKVSFQLAILHLMIVLI